MSDSTPVLAAAISDIECDIDSLRPKDVYIRETWYPFIARARQLSHGALDDYTRSELTKIVFIIWDLQEQRGPKHKEKVRQKLLKHLRNFRANLVATPKT